jgi:cytidyltransferase-like protein
MRIFEEYLIESEVSINGEPCGLFLGRFQPFHNGHLESIKKISKELGNVKVCVFYSVSNLKNKSLSKELTEDILTSVADKYDDIIAGFYPTSIAFIGNLITLAQQDGFLPMGISCGPDRAVQYQQQITKIKSGQYIKDGITCSPDFRVIEFESESKVHATEIRKAILQDDRNFFQQNTPSIIHQYYNRLQKELQKIL